MNVERNSPLQVENDRLTLDEKLKIELRKI